MKSEEKKYSDIMTKIQLVISEWEFVNIKKSKTAFNKIKKIVDKENG
jgi:hypothetical protein